MKTLFATCGVAALALSVSACGQGPHGPPKVQASQPAEQGTTVVQMQSQVGTTMLFPGPHGPPRVLQRPTVQTEPALYDGILEAFDEENIDDKIRDCKVLHLTNYRVAERRWRKTGGMLDADELKALEAWLDIIIHRVYVPDIPRPANTIPMTPPAPAVFPNCQAF